VSYFVGGWIEATYGPPEVFQGVSSWLGVVNFGSLVFNSDEVTGLLFGLDRPARLPGSPLFEGLGIPEDACEEVTRDFERNAKFVEEYGEGEFGHTFATWKEILEVDFAARNIDLGESDWSKVFAFAELLVRQGYAPEHIRFVASGNW
jgi:hypothetical protein